VHRFRAAVRLSLAALAFGLASQGKSVHAPRHWRDNPAASVGRKAAMDWTLAIERNGQALRRILAMLVAMAGLGGAAAFTSPLWGGRRSSDRRVGVVAGIEPPAGASPRPPHEGEVEPARLADRLLPAAGCRFLPRHLHRAILRLLRPAEAAARRLVIVAARELEGRTPQAREASTPPRRHGPLFVRDGRGTGIVLRGGRPIPPALAAPRPAPRRLALPLFDTLRGWPRRPNALAGGVPRISLPGIAEPPRGPARRPLLPDDPIDATRLLLRLQALGRALDDLPGHARRFARWRCRMLAGAQGGGRGPRRISPLRPSRPPGSRRRSTHEVHEVLADLHYFAFHALRQFPPGRAAASRPEGEERRDTS
jgi:hypothetical protein